MPLRLPRPSQTYDVADQSALRTLLEQAHLQSFRRGEDLTLQNGERLIVGSKGGLTAHAGGGQANALVLTNEINHLSTVANAADSVALPPAAAGRRVTVINRGANACQVFGQGTDTINGVAGTGVSQAINTKVTYECPLAGQWFF